ncbi:MAG TPA: hypothetical protein VFB76_15985 [Candidatus Angelobacter sp.]|nr:hypothetical protein [Candidatus Angelobacter sp.]
METKRTTTRFSYRIEEKPGGGFIARSTDPGAEPLEGETREEVMRNVEAKISAIIGEQLPSFKFGGVNLTAKAKVNVTHQTRFGASADQASQTDFSQPGLPQSIDSMGPIMRGNRSDPMGLILRVLAALIGVAALIYFFFHR